MDQWQNVFVFDLETYIENECATPYAAGLYNVNQLREMWKMGLIPVEIEIEKKNVLVFDESKQNPVMNKLETISENYWGDEKTYIDRNGDQRVSSYRLLSVGNNASGLDSWVVINSLVKDLKEKKICKRLGDWFFYRFGVELY